MNLWIQISDLARGVVTTDLPVRLVETGSRGAVPVSDSHRRAGWLECSGIRADTGYQLTIDAADYYAARQLPTCYPRPTITFRTGPAGDHDLTVLLQPYSYQTHIQVDDGWAAQRRR